MTASNVALRQSPDEDDGVRRLPGWAINLAEIPPANLNSCARVLARHAVEKAVSELRLTALDTGPTSGDDAGQTIKNGPAGAANTDEAKERVI